MFVARVCHEFWVEKSLADAFSRLCATRHWRLRAPTIQAISDVGRSDALYEIDGVPRQERISESCLPAAASSNNSSRPSGNLVSTPLPPSQLTAKDNIHFAFVNNSLQR